ncbi:MAG: biotin transporter BioY [Planctomycetes bacterium]|nr:biotin transporter BioY [Planctomycetota bacterium]
MPILLIDTPRPPDSEPVKLEALRDLAQIALFAALTGAGAFIHVPLGPLFLSLQTMMVMLAGFVLGPKKAALAMLAYLACGFIGLPVFGQGRAGPAYFLGPTAGYLPGFVIGAFIAGCSVHIRCSRTAKLALSALLGAVGAAALLACGAIGLRCIAVDSWSRAFLVGFFPFLPGDLLKMAAALSIKEIYFPTAEPLGNEPAIQDGKAVQR